LEELKLYEFSTSLHSSNHYTQSILNLGNDGTSLLSLLLGQDHLTPAHDMLRLDTTHTSSQATTDLDVVVEVGASRLADSLEVRDVLFADLIYLVS
jgi:hypothetical protein